jgi:integrase
MRLATYIFLRDDSGVPTYFFRWKVPVKVRPLLGGKKELRRSLRTNKRRLALRLAKRLSVLLERGVFELMASREKPAFHLTVKLFEQLADGGIRLEGLEADPNRLKEEQELLNTLLGSAKPPSNGGRKTLADLVKAFLAEGERAGRWTPKTLQEQQAIYAMLLEIVGPTKPLGSLGRTDLVQFKETLQKLPPNRSKRYKGKAVSELAAMSLPASELMKVNTINKVLIRVSSLLKWGVTHDYIAQNYAEGMTLPKGKRDDEERAPYTDAEVRSVIEAVTKGEHGSDSLPYRKWVPLIGAYSGMRLNEICQLALADFSEVEGIHVMAVTDEGDEQRVKTSNARRYVPVHPALVDAGLVAYVNKLREQGETRLFPELSKGRDGYGAIPSKWYARFRERLGLKDRDYHGLRHTVVNKLREAEVPEDLVADIVGHARSDGETFGRYAKAASVKRAYEAICKLHYNTASTL